MVEEGRSVSIEYTLKLEDGETVDSNVGGEALTYVQGRQQILPALEEALAGLEVDDSKEVRLTPEQGYGAVDPEAFRKVPASEIPEEARQAGAQLIARDDAGRQRPVRVHDVSGDEVTVDLNHPLAGQTLNFEVKILAIE